MSNFGIDDAIAKCKDRAHISALHHMMRTSQEWELTAVWLEDLRDASSTIQVAELDPEDRGERRDKLTKLVVLSYEYGQRHDPIGKQELINQIIAGRWDA